MKPININWKLTWGLLKLIILKLVFEKMTFTHHFIDISTNIFNLWVRLIFPKTRHLGLHFKHNNEPIPIRIEKIWFFKVNSENCYKSYKKNRGFRHLASSSLQPTSKYWNRVGSWFSLILHQSSLNTLLFIFSPSLLYKSFISSILGHIEISSPLSYWVLMK